MKEALDKLVHALLAPFISKYVGSFVRTWLSALGGALVGWKLIDAEAGQTWVQLTAMILDGLILILIAQMSSLVEKKMRDQK